MRVSAPLEIEKQKKKEKNVIRANLQLFHLYFAPFFSRKYHFLCYFLSWAPPWKIEKQQKKCSPPLRIPGHATVLITIGNTSFYYYFFLNIHATTGFFLWIEVDLFEIEKSGPFFSVKSDIFKTREKRRFQNTSKATFLKRFK